MEDDEEKMEGHFADMEKKIKLPGEFKNIMMCKVCFQLAKRPPVATCCGNIIGCGECILQAYQEEECRLISPLDKLVKLSGIDTILDNM